MGNLLIHCTRGEEGVGDFLHRLCLLRLPLLWLKTAKSRFLKYFRRGCSLSLESGVIWLCAILATLALLVNSTLAETVQIKIYLAFANWTTVSLLS